MTFYTYFLVVAFLFFVGSVLGWITEVLFRRFFSAKKWINPGFLTGPYLPLYGFGVVFLYALSLLPVNTGYAWLDAIIIILIMGACMTLLEYVTGLIFIKGMKIKLWDYSNRWGNVQGIICPLFSFFWTAVGAFYYLVLHGSFLKMVTWFENNIAFAFFVGVILGVFIVDLAHSVDLSVKIRRFAKENKVVIAFEKLKLSIKENIETGKKHANFIFPFRSRDGLENQLKSYFQKIGDKLKQIGTADNSKSNNKE